MDHKARWNTRYRDVGDDYLFGIKPNHFVARRTHLFQEGHTALSVADERLRQFAAMKNSK